MGVLGEQYAARGAAVARVAVVAALLAGCSGGATPPGGGGRGGAEPAYSCVDPALPAARAATTTVRHVHASGYEQVPAEEFEPDVDALMASTDVLTTTEVQDPARAAVLREDGWARVWPARGPLGARNTGIALRRSAWRVVDGGWVRLSPLTFTRVGGASSPRQAAVWALAEHRATGRTLFVSVAHLPPSVTVGAEWNGAVPQRIAVWRDALAGWAAHTRSVLASEEPDAVLVTGDWNVDVRQGPLRRELDAAWSPLGLELSFDPVPEGQTFDGLGGLGVIDFTYAGGAGARVARAGCILDALPSSNHDPVETVLRLRR